jgi:signal transduction histidine kinase
MGPDAAYALPRRTVEAPRPRAPTTERIPRVEAAPAAVVAKPAQPGRSEIAVQEIGRRSLAGTLGHVILFIIGEAQLSLHERTSGIFTAALALIVACRLVARHLAPRRQVPLGLRWGLLATGALGPNVLWGVLSASISFANPTGSESVVIAVITCGVAAGLVGALAPAMWLHRVSLVLLMIPVSIGAAVNGSFWFGAMHWLFFGFMIVQGTAVTRAYWQSIAANEQLAAHAEAERRTALEMAETNRHLRAEMNERARIELELRQAQKLQAIGRLAAGIAHEINTPVQYVTSSCEFLRDGVDQLHTAVADYEALVAELVAGTTPLAAATVRAEAVAAAADLAFLREELPRAIDTAMDGLRRVTTIVTATKQFAYPHKTEKVPGDLNEAIASTLVISANETKLVADVKAEYGELPLVSCHLGEINQVVLNLVVNAAHAIDEARGGNGPRGVITVKTWADPPLGRAYISVTDTGPGIPAEVLDKIYEPFFTTKPVGKGTGQGLAIARSVVVERHAGTLDVATERGVGTTFTIGLPIGPPVG